LVPSDDLSVARAACAAGQSAAVGNDRRRRAGHSLKISHFGGGAMPVSAYSICRRNPGDDGDIGRTSGQPGDLPAWFIPFLKMLAGARKTQVRIPTTSLSIR
jgi:hypothetical protein